MNDSPALRLWVVMNRAFRSISEPLHRQVEAHGLSFTEFAVLEILLHKGPLAIGEIGERILLTSGSMTYVVDKLEKRGLLERRACAEDRRVTRAVLTPEGRTLIERVFTEHAEHIEALLAGLSAREQEQAAELLKRLGYYAQGAAIRLAGAPAS